MITNEIAATMLADMVRVESVTPWLVPGGSGERAIAEHIAEWATDLPVGIDLDEVQEGRVNTLIRLKGAGDGPTLCVNAHADTVGYANWADRALEPRIEGDLMYGLGAADDKAGCVAALLALRELVETGASLRGDLLVALVCDEEGISIGTEALLERHEIDATLIVEPDRLPVAIVEHQGFGWIDVIVRGKASHGSAPDAGVDAIVHMAEVVQRLHRLDREVFQANPDPMNGRTVFHTGTVSGGTDYATYPSRAVLGIEIGTQPGEHLSDRVKEIETIFDEVRLVHPQFSGEVEVKVEREPFRAVGHETLLEAMDAAAVDELGTPLKRAGLNAWADSGLTQGAGIPTVMFGPLGGNFHSPDEWISIPEVAASARIVEGTARRFLG